MTKEKFKIIFAGTPEFAAVALRTLIEDKQDIIAVYTQPDRPAGRGRKLAASPVKQLALEHSIPVEQPESLKGTDAITQLQFYGADVMIVAAYGLLLPEEVLKIPTYGCINIHASLLPRWRGAAPIQRAILEGDIETGITIMQMDVGLDTGDMLLKLTTPISHEDTGGSLHDRLAQLGGQAIVETMTLLQQGKLTPEKQDDSAACYAKKLDKQEAWIDWSQGAEQIHRQIRAFDPWPVAQTKYDDKIIRIRKADFIEPSVDKTPGTIIRQDKTALDVACGQGQLRILDCQLPGSRPMSITDVLNGHPNLFSVGTQFSNSQ